MELHEIVKEKFGALDKDTLRIIIMAKNPCDAGIEWYDKNFNGDFSAVPIKFISWFAAPFLREANLSGANLRGAKHDEYTIWPEGFDFETEVQ